MSYFTIIIWFVRKLVFFFVTKYLNYQSHGKNKRNNNSKQTNQMVVIFSNGFIKLVQKTDRTHSTCHLFLLGGGLPHKNPHRLLSGKTKGRSYPREPRHSFTSGDQSWRKRERRGEGWWWGSGQKGGESWNERKTPTNTCRRGSAVYHGSKTEMNLKKKSKTVERKKRCYNKIVNTSIAIETGAEIHRKKKGCIFFFLTVWLTWKFAIKVHKLINTVHLYNGKK